MPRYDLHTQALSPDEQRSTFKIMTFGYPEGLGVKGFQMLINIWARTLLTRRGSDPTALARGTGFTNLIGSNIPPENAEDLVRAAVDEATQQVLAFQRKDQTLTNEERLADARVLKYVVDDAAPGFDVFVEIRNVANKRILMNLPELVRRAQG